MSVAAGPFPDLRARRAAMEADTRASLLSAAATVLSEEGPAALTVRRVADAVNASTKMIYTHFGGKDGLLEALYLHSFAGLTQALRALEGEPAPGRRLALMMQAYRGFALSEPALYNVMFGDLGRAWEAPLVCRRQAWASFQTLRETVGACLEASRAGEAGRITRLLWAAVHGVVSLELRKLLGTPSDSEQLFLEAVDAICRSQRLTHQPVFS